MSPWIYMLRVFIFLLLLNFYEKKWHRTHKYSFVFVSELLWFFWLNCTQLDSRTWVSTRLKNHYRILRIMYCFSVSISTIKLVYFSSSLDSGLDFNRKQRTRSLIPFSFYGVSAVLYALFLVYSVPPFSWSCVCFFINILMFSNITSVPLIFFLDKIPHTKIKSLPK